MLRKTATWILYITALSSTGSLHAAETRNIKATELLLGFSELNNSASGQLILQENLNTSIATNNTASETQRARAITDNTIAALLGSINNGLLVANALGEKMYAIFSAHNSINAATGESTTFSKNFEALLSQVNTLILVDSSFAKNYYANGSANGNPAQPVSGISLPIEGKHNVYDLAYHPTNENRNSVGNSRPIQVAPDRIQPISGVDFFGVETNTYDTIFPTVKNNAAFPSGHAAFGFSSSLLFAQMVPERFQEFVLRGSEYGNSRVVLGVHYALDVIGARIMTTYTLAQILNNNPDYLAQNISNFSGSPITTSDNFQTLMQSAQSDLRNLLEQGCQTTLAECALADKTARLNEKAQNKADYLYRMTYGLSPIGPTDLAPVVPEGAEILLTSRFPYLNAEQRRDVLATTEIESGHALDDGSGWARLNLYSAADGYGAFNGDVTVTMNASEGGFSAYDEWGNDIGGNGSLVKKGSGTLELSGNNSFSGTTSVGGGSLIINGYHGNSAVTVEPGARLGGSGTVGALTAQTASVVAPGNSIGTLTVENNITFQPGSHYQVEIAADGSSDLIESDQSAILHGGNVSVSLLGTGNLLSQQTVPSLLGQQYRILSAKQGISGQFDTVQSEPLFLKTHLNYQPEQLFLHIERNNLAFSSVAQSPNERALANAADALATGNPLYESLLLTNSPSAARQAYRQLSGQIHADIASAQINQNRHLRDTWNERLHQNKGPSHLSEIKANDSGAWAQLSGDWERASGDNGISGYHSSTYGVLMGADSTYAKEIQLGISAGYNRTSLDADDSANANANATSHNYQIGVYGAKQLGDFALRAGSSYTWHRIETSRHVTYDLQSDNPTGKYRASSTQLFAEAAYPLQTTAANLEPFASLAYINFANKGLAEEGGAAALHADKQHIDTGVSVLGLRADTQLQAISLQGELGWQHQYGDQHRATGLILSGGETPFIVNSVPISRNGALLKARAMLAVSKNSLLSIGYSGLLSQNHQDHRIKADFNWQF